MILVINKIGFKKLLTFYGDEGDALILISAGGNSKNMVNAANFAKQKNRQDNALSMLKYENNSF